MDQAAADRCRKVRGDGGRASDAALRRVTDWGGQCCDGWSEVALVDVIEDAAQDCDAERSGDLLQRPGERRPRTGLGRRERADNDVEGRRKRNPEADTDRRQ